MNKKILDNFLLLIATEISIDKVIKPFIEVIDKETIHKIKWLYASEHRINDVSYLSISLNETTFQIIKKLKKYNWTFVPKYVLKDKFHNLDYKVVSTETGFYKYKLINALSHQYPLNETVAIDNNLWKLLTPEQQVNVSTFLISLKSKRKVDFCQLAENFKDFKESLIANCICEQANSYKKHFQLTRIGQNIIFALGGIKNIIDFHLERNAIIFTLENVDLANKKTLAELEAIKKVKNNTTNLLTLTISYDFVVIYEMIKKIIRESFCPLYI